MPRLPTFLPLLLILLGALMLVRNAAHARSAAPDIRPAAGGWYQQGSNFGNLNFDIGDDGLVAGTWSTYRDGRPVWYYFQAPVTHRSFADAEADGIVAVVVAPLYEAATGSACPTCPYVPPQWVSDHSMRLEFTSTRAATFISGTTRIPLVAWMQGPPLLPQRDYTGDWIAATRVTSETGVDYQSVVTMRLQARANGLGRREYAMSCIRPVQACAQWNGALGASVPCVHFCASELYLWFDADESGRMERVFDLGLGTVEPYPAAYGSQDRIVVRRTAATSLAMSLIRLPDGLFRIATPEDAP